MECNERLVVFVVCLLFHSASSRPNIVVIMADDLGWNDVSFHGSDQIPTPNIDALAYSGVILNRHYTLPTCTPSRAAFMTGMYPMKIGMQGRPLRCGEPRGVPLEQMLLPQRLQELGYVTRLVGKWHLGYHYSDYLPTKRGFHSHFGFWNGYVGYFDYMIDQNVTTSENDQDYFIGYDLHRDMNISYAERGRYATDVFTDEAVRIIATHNKTHPLYLHVAHLAVHSGRESNPLEVPNPEEAQIKFKHIKDPKRRLFAEMTVRLDESVGKIVTVLKEKEILNNTIIIFLTDNGAMTIGPHQNWGSNWPLRGLKFTLFEGGVRGVAALWSPFLVNPGRTSSHMMHMTDWYPTIYSMAGGNVNELQVDGIDQWPLLKMGSANNIHRDTVLLNMGDFDDIAGLISGRWKLVHSTYYNGQFDGYYGDDGRSSPNTNYRISDIISSPVFMAFNSLKHGKMPSEQQLVEKFKQLRRESTVICPDENRMNKEGPLCSGYCVFDIESDPCETNNLQSTNSQVLNNLIFKLQMFRHDMVHELTESVSAASNPKFYNGVWVPWLDYEYVDIFQKMSKATHLSLDSCVLKLMLLGLLLLHLFNF